VVLTPRELACAGDGQGEGDAGRTPGWYMPQQFENRPTRRSTATTAERSGATVTQVDILISGVARRTITGVSE